MIRDDEPLYPIGVVSKMFNIHPQTLRQYEKEGVIKINRTEGKKRLYSKKDLERIGLIISLLRDFKINLSGIEIILQLKEELENIYSEISRLNLELPPDNVLKKKKILIQKENFSLVLCSINEKSGDSYE